MRLIKLLRGRCFLLTFVPQMSPEMKLKANWFGKPYCDEHRQDTDILPKAKFAAAVIGTSQEKHWRIIRDAKSLTEFCR